MMLSCLKKRLLNFKGFGSTLVLPGRAKIIAYNFGPCQAIVDDFVGVLQFRVGHGTMGGSYLVERRV
jgi:hypothetical protein